MCSLDILVFPDVQEGSLAHIMATKTIAFEKALDETYSKYNLTVQKKTDKKRSLL